jgi:hypothetical protein
MLANNLVFGSVFAAVLAVLAWPLVQATLERESAARTLALTGVLALGCGYLSLLFERVTLALLATVIGPNAAAALTWQWSPQAALLALWVAVLWCVSYWALREDTSPTASPT